MVTLTHALAAGIVVGISISVIAYSLGYYHGMRHAWREMRGWMAPQDAVYRTRDTTTLEDDLE